MITFTSKFGPGESILIGDGSILGKINAINFARNSTHPIYQVEWFADGLLKSAWLHEQDITGETDHGR